MTIKQIAYKVNEVSEEKDALFSKIQEIRRKHGEKPRSTKPFANFSIKDNYAFHAGGRKQLQFNIGEENDWESGSIFRYGVALSLYQDHTLHNPKAEFRPIVNRFNNFLLENPDFFTGFAMWVYSKRRFVEYFNEVRPIDEDLFDAEKFIFIGKYFEKPMARVNEQDIYEIVRVFDYLMPMYEVVQFGSEKIPARLARLCWNDNGWVLPSGPYGKSPSSELHEGKYGYGHEEWLFDLGKMIDNFHYGFLEPVRKHHDAFAGKVYDVYLYAIHSETAKRYLVGRIKEAEVIDKALSDSILHEYNIRGWFKEMQEQIRASGASGQGFSDWKGIDLFNIRFFPAKAQLYTNYIELPPGHYLYSQSRYSFFHYHPDADSDDETPTEFEFIENTSDKDGSSRRSSSKYVRAPRVVELLLLHKEIADKLAVQLQEKYGLRNVTREHPASYENNRIDIVVNDKGKLVFYEIKTYASIKASIREAMGQLMEYSHWINKRRCDEMIIVSHVPATDGLKNYFEFLRGTYGLNLFYQSFDLAGCSLSERV